MDEIEQILDGCTEELFDAIEKKDKEKFRAALEALVLHIQDADEEQDEMESK